MKMIKKLTAFLLTFVLIIGIIPLAAFSVSAEKYKIGYIFTSGVNIREDATTSSNIIANVSKLTVTVIGSKEDVNGATKTVTTNDGGKKQVVYTWYNILYTKDFKTVEGYVREDLITVKEYTLDASFKEELSEFPESYHNDLMLLHAIYPNWKFTADPVPESFSNSVKSQDKAFTKLLTGSSPISWRSMRKGCYNWETNKFITTDGGRYAASREVIAYYMDPRNFLNANDIYIYLQQSYDNNTQTVSGIEKIVNGTFLDAEINNIKDKYNGIRYATVIRKAASDANVNAYVLASTIIQEQGTKGSTLSNGKATYNGKTVYNFFNYSASGTTSEEIIKNASKYAYNQGWFTPSESIIGGAEKYSSGYIAEGQDTYFYKNFNVLNPDKIWHQYAQSVTDSQSSATGLRITYSDLYNMSLTFRIPVYKSLPSQKSKLPSVSDKYNNYYFEKLSVDGIDPQFDRYTTTYNLTTDSGKIITYKLPSGATYIGESTYPLTKGKNTIKLNVKSETGYTNTYTFTINSTKSGTLTLQPSGGTLKKESDNNWYYYVDNVKTKATTLVKYNGKWFYVKNGVWDSTANTLIKHSDNWFYIKNGKWSTKTDLIKYNGKWFYVKNGKWDNSINTLFKKNGKWFAIKSGKWYKEKAIIKYSGKKFYVNKGFAQLDRSGKVKINNKSYKIKNGKVV